MSVAGQKQRNVLNDNGLEVWRPLGVASVEEATLKNEDGFPGAFAGLFIACLHVIEGRKCKTMQTTTVNVVEQKLTG